jgi:3-oxoadipate enol-lactonase
VLRYDTRGAGLSQKVRGELGIDTMADDITALLDGLGIAGKVALAGMPSVVRSRFISPPDTLSAPAPSRSAARRPASRRIAAPRRLNASQGSRPPAWPSPSPIRC